MKKRLLLAVYSISLGLSAQKIDSVAIKYANMISSEELKSHLNILASDEYEGRETGKKGQKMAMEYLINEFQKMEIAPSQESGFKQTFDLIEQENKGITITIGTKNFQLNKDFIFSPSIIIENQEIISTLVFAGYGLKDETFNSYNGIDIKDKLVFVVDGYPKKWKSKKEWTNKKRADLAKSLGAAGIFFYKKDLTEFLEKNEHYFNKPKMVLAPISEKEFISIVAGKEVFNALFEDSKNNLEKVEKSGKFKKEVFEKEVKINIDKPTSHLTGENVLAFIPGTDLKEELVVITAHYDHIGKSGEEVFNGADDDGTGTVSLIEIAESFQSAVKNGKGPRRSILIMPVSGEEKGLLGSRYYTNNPVFPLKNTVCNLNIDMIGRYDEAHEMDSNYVYLIGSDKLSQELHQLSEEVNKNYIGINLDYTFNDENDPNRFYYRSDHYNFAKNNIPVIFYFSGVHEDYHKSTDTVEKIDFEKTEKIARLVFLTAWEIANRNERIKLD